MKFTLKDYPGVPHAQLKDASRLKNLDYDNPRLEDVEKAFKKISKTANFMAINDHGLVKRPRYSGRNRGDSVTRTHFQGMNRTKDGRSFIFSGGDLSDSVAQIFSTTVDHFKNNIQFSSSQSAREKGNIIRGPIGSNIFDNSVPPDSDKLNFITQVNDRPVDGEDEKGFWHAGGTSIAGDILSVPLESKKDSLIRFFSIKNPNKPVHLEKCDIPRGISVGKAGTASLCRLSNDRFLCAVWQDGAKKGEQCIDFYVSKDTQLENGFKLRKLRWFYKDMVDIEKKDTKFQVLEFVIQEDGQIYLVGTANTSSAPMPDAQKENIAELMKLSFDLDLIDQPTKFEDSITISLINRREFTKSQEYFVFSAGASVYVSPEKELILYAVYHFLRDSEIRFVEFPPVIENYEEEVTEISHAKIELYEKENFKGKVIRIYGNVGSTINDYKKCFTQEDNFGKGIGSVKYILPKNYVYEFFEDKDCKKKNLLFPMPGKGVLHSQKKIGRLGKKVRSSKLRKLNT